MSITRAHQKVVDAVDAALLVRNKAGRVPGSLEYPWYLPYNILLNNVVADSQYVAVNAQHVFSYMSNAKKEIQRIPDYVVIHTSVARKKGSRSASVSSTVCAVVEIKPFGKDVTGIKVKQRKLGVKFINVQKQSELQACLALAISPNQVTVVAVIAVGDMWRFTVYQRVPDVMSAEGLPTITKKVSRTKKGIDDDHFIPLIENTSEFSNETINGCREFKKERKKIIDEENW